MKFEQYRIGEGIKTSISKLGYKKPTDIQYKSIPPILKGEDVLAIAQTGTGKTVTSSSRRHFPKSCSLALHLSSEFEPILL